MNHVERRRTFLLRAILFACWSAFALSETPRSLVADAGNAFSERFRQWASAFNGIHSNEQLDVREFERWDPLPSLWRRVESARRNWARALK